MQGIAKGYYQFGIWILRFTYLNILWMAFTLLGCIVFGLVPATTAMFAVVRKWVAGEDDIPIFQTFWKSYKTVFFQVNGLGLLLGLIGYSLIIEFQILRSQDSLVYFIASYGVVALMTMYGIVLLYFFPIYVHFDLKIWQFMKWPFIIGVIHPILTIFLAGFVFLIYYVLFSTLPALIFLIGGSVTAYVITWGASRTFEKYEMPNEAVTTEVSTLEKIS